MGPAKPAIDAPNPATPLVPAAVAEAVPTDATVVLNPAIAFFSAALAAKSTIPPVNLPTAD